MTIRRVAIRADASVWIGTGHVMRCATLAENLIAAGIKVHFLCREMPGDRCGWLESKGISVHRLTGVDRPLMVGSISQHQSWLGVSLQQEISESCEKLAEIGPIDWLVVDHYGLDIEWERAMRPYSCRIFVIDDLADRNHDADLLLDQNLFTNPANRYAERVTTSCRLMLGPRYALLQPAYHDLRPRIPPRKGTPLRLLIFFGGADSADLTYSVLRMLKDLVGRDCEIDAVVGASNQSLNRIEVLAREMSGVVVHQDVPSLAPLIARADLAIGAAGATTWERCSLGLPSAVITVADNQVPIARELQDREICKWLGDARTLDWVRLKDELARLLECHIQENWSRKCSEIVDGKGVLRVALAMHGIDSNTRLSIRKLQADDASEIANLRHKTDDGGCFREFSREQRDIENFYGYVVEAAPRLVVGAVFFRRTQKSWSLDVCLDPLYQTPQLGDHLERLALHFHRQSVYRSDMVCLNGSGGLQVSFCSDQISWINSWIADLIVDCYRSGHHVSWTHDAATLKSGDLCFFLGYGRIVSADVLARHKNNLVVHASDLPEGRGWSPLTWQILQGRAEIVVSLFEAAESVDAGCIYLQEKINFCGDELLDELRMLLGSVSNKLCRRFLANYPECLKINREQAGVASYYPRRGPLDSQINAELPLVSQFNLLRTVDNHSYPAWFELYGCRYLLRIEKG